MKCKDGDSYDLIVDCQGDDKRQWFELRRRRCNRGGETRRGGRGPEGVHHRRHHHHCHQRHHRDNVQMPIPDICHERRERFARKIFG